MDEWKDVKLSEIADVQTGPFGSQLHMEDYVERGTPIVTVEHLGNREFSSQNLPRVTDTDKERLQKYILKTGDVVFSRVGSVDRCSYVSEKENGWMFSGRCLRIRAIDSTVEPLYLYYYFTSESIKQIIRSIAVGATMPSINTSILSGIPVSLPPLPEQKRIAHILGTLDDKIELNRRMNATLEAMARALFKSWFVDFDPVRAKIDGRKPEGLDSETAALFPSHFEHGEHGQIPVGWKSVPITDVCAINDWSLGKSDRLTTIEYIEISEVSSGNISNIATYSRGEEPSRARRRLRHGDTIISTVRPDRGSYCLALNPPKNRIASTGFAVLTPTKAPWSFVHAAMTLPDLFDHLGQMADGGAYPAVRPDVIGAWNIILPDNQHVLAAYHHVCAPLYEMAEVNRLQSRKLSDIRDTLLPKLLNGTISTTERKL